MKKNFNEQLDMVYNRINHLVKTDTFEKNYDITKDKYSPTFSESTSTSKVCSLYNNKGQGDYGNCWAAAVATIVNYIKGSNVSATAVCDKMKIGYDEGGTPGEAQLALSKYSVDYNNLNMDMYNKMTWSSLKSNINSKYPVYVSAKNGSSGHAVTAYGYRTISVTDYVVIWNSGLNDGKGASQVVYFNYNGTIFSYNNKTWTWTFSLSKFA